MTNITNQRTDTNWTSYLAVGIAEGFEETDNIDMVLEAWAYIGQNGLYRELQGFFGRTLHSIVDAGYLTTTYVPMWGAWDEAHN